MTKQQVINELNSLYSKGLEILKTKYNPNSGGGNVAFIGFPVTVDNKLFISWHTNVNSFLSAIFPVENHYLIKFSEMENNTFSNASACTELIKNLIEQIEKGVILVDGKNTNTNYLSDLDIIFSRFHNVARQLRSRHANRNTLNIKDEYDVQELLHALLRLYFDDIRPEEWTPSYAGGSSRMDFLLKNEKVVIEVKKTRSSMSDKDLGEQLIVDIEKYQTHPDCERLICFVYDPEGLLGNPTGMENDLNSKHGGFVDVIIKP
jgi:hypothetical protein